ncbi:MAG TPA: hypothetical protein VFG81_05745 [Anaerolineales bacterium]|nr:hypothetical protein [Anaerolineales bacterium]
MMNPKIIVVDGKTYNSVEEMPADIRHKYEQAMRSLGDANQNQIPDVFESMNIFADKDKDGTADALETMMAGHHSARSMKIIVDGKEFDGLEHLPPEARAKYEEAMGKLDANRNGIPDFVEGMIQTTNQNVMSGSNPIAESARRSPPPPSSSAITPDTSNGWMLMLAALFLFLLCVVGVGGVWYFFLR